MNGPSHATSFNSSTASLTPRLQQGLDAVRARLPKERDFEVLYEHYHQQLVRVPELFANSEPRRHEALTSIVTSIAMRLQPGFSVRLSSMYELGDTGFWHGSVMGTRGIACSFYDELVGVGLVALCNPFDGTGRTYLLRLTREVLGKVDAAIRAVGDRPN